MKNIERIRKEFEDKYCVLFNGKPVLNDEFFSAIEQYIMTEKAKMLEEIVKLYCKKDVCIEDLAKIGRKHCK